jgi:hypothetical protein
MDEKEDDAHSKSTYSTTGAGNMGEAIIGTYEREARQKWNSFFNSLGIFKPLDMIKHCEKNPDIGEQIVHDVIAGMNKDKEIANEHRST